MCVILLLSRLHLSIVVLCTESTSEGLGIEVMLP